MKNAKEFKLIECSGTPYEIGRQWGEGCKESLFRVSENAFNGMNLMYQAPREEVIARAMKFLPFVQEFDPYLIEIMRGQSDGAGISFEEIFTQKCMNELTFYYSGKIIGLCTSFAATGEATQDGKTLLGQNIDWLVGAPIDLLKINHSNGLAQFILSFANSTEFTFSSAGFGMCVNATLGQDYSFNIPLACYL
ncbi:MAG: C45 family autoproteolytic acyltransferase/hydrolase, partial [Bacteroidales bacterium]|nr:C45 family autoproteolytic acyltransferase/hydrolase [Bacteroidales bacterium]